MATMTAPLSVACVSNLNDCRRLQPSSGVSNVVLDGSLCQYFVGRGLRKVEQILIVLLARGCGTFRSLVGLTRAQLFEGAPTAAQADFERELLKLGFQYR